MSAHMGLRNFLNQISNMRGWPCREIGGGQFGIEVMLPSRRSQVVYSLAGNDPDGVEMVYFWSSSIPMTACPDPFMLMQESVQLSYGSYAIKDGNIIVKTSRVAQFLNIEEMVRVLFFVGKYADELEARVMGHHYDQT